MSLFAFGQEGITVELYGGFSKRKADDRMRTAGLMEEQTVTWLSWRCGARHRLLLLGLERGGRGAGARKLAWWSSMSQQLSMGLFLDYCSCIVWNLSDRADDGDSVYWHCDQSCLRDIKLINTWGVAGCLQQGCLTRFCTLCGNQPKGLGAQVCTEGEADLIVLCRLVPWPHSCHTILYANPELTCHWRGYLGHLWNFFLSLGNFPCGEYLFSTAFFCSVSNCSLSK